MTGQPLVALVTGGSSGIGKATAQLLREEGYSVSICGRDPDRLKAAADELGDVQIVHADLAVPEDAQRAIAETVDQHGRLDALINAHGVLGEPAPLADLSIEQWREVMETNLMGPIWTTTAAVESLEQTRGCVVNVSSINAIQSEPWMAPYGVSKSGLVGFTKYAAADLAQFGIRVNAVLPGWVRTPMAVPWFEEAGVQDRPMATNYMSRPAEPREIAEVIAFLASSKASYMTGSIVVADGGHWIKMQELRPLEP